MAYDRWGNGRSDPRIKLALPYFNDDLVDLRELINRLGITPVMLVGHSDGGTLALLYAAQQPGQVACLVVVAAHIYIELEGKRGIEGIRYQFEDDLDFQEKLQRIHGDRYKQVYYNWYHGWHNPEVLKWDLRPVISKITCPALIIQGMQDEHASPGHARDIAGTIPDAEIWLPPGVGHMLPQDAADLDQDEVEVTTKFHSGEIEEHQHPEVKWVKEFTSEMTKAALDEMVKKTKEMKDKIK